jgi:hypothetical protein
MTFRYLVSVAAAVLAAACSGNSGGKASDSATRTQSKTAVDSSGGSVASGSANGGTTEKAKDPLPSNHMGKIPVLEYHVIKEVPNALYTRNIESFKQDLEDVYRRGYRPITIAQMLVFVFDDASPEQFSYKEGPNGQLTIDQNSGVGIWEDFMKSHPGWKNRGTFCILNGASAGHNMFGDNPKYNGQQKAWRFQKLKWLADQGFELCDHTVWHMKLSQYPDDKVQGQISANMMAIDSAVPGYKVRTLALPYGLWPKNKQLAWQGTWTDPKTGQAHPYHFDAVLEVAGGPTLSPYDPKFDPHHITRIQAVGNDIHSVLDGLDKNKTRFVK